MSAASNAKAESAKQKLEAEGHTFTGRNSAYATLKFLGFRYNIRTQDWEMKQMFLPGLEPEVKS